MGKTRKESIYDYCRELHPDDGIPDRQQRKSLRIKENHPRPRKGRYLKETARAVDQILLCSQLPGPFRLVAVQEAETSPTLEVLLAIPAADVGLDAWQILLLGLRQAVRQEIARTINRKRTPDVRIRLVPESEVRS